MHTQESEIRRVPCLMIAAPASGNGKTTVTALLARWHRNRGLRVRVFKIGPDFIDPMMLERASGAPVYSLDSGMMPDEHISQLLYDAANAADIVLLEGMMGLHDGEHSAAALAKRFNISVALVIDVSAMAQTAAAVAYGLAQFDPMLRVAGVFANRTASDGHAAMIRDALPDTLPWLGALARDEKLHLPERHLGLQQAAEIPYLDDVFDDGSARLSACAITTLAPVAQFARPLQTQQQPLLQSRRIAIARDAAFSFVYAANLDCLREMGAKLIFISPLTDAQLPACDAVYLPGGYPELHAATLAGNASFLRSIRTFRGRIVAECGGLLYLLQRLGDSHGGEHTLAGLLSGEAQMQHSLQGLGWQQVAFAQGTLLAHTFHYSSARVAHPAWLTAQCRYGNAEHVYRVDNIIASYLHWYFASNPRVAAQLFLED